MPVQPTYPGVYVQEVPSGVRTIVGVSTSVTAFVGTAKRGPINKPITIYNYGDFEKRFGGLSADSEMSYAVRSFFLNGGSQAVIVRLARNPTQANLTLNDTATVPAPRLIITALDAGLGGNDIDVITEYNTPTPDSTFNLTVRYRSVDAPTQNRTEFYPNLSLNSSHSRYALNVVNPTSELVSLARTSVSGFGWVPGIATGPYISGGATPEGIYAGYVDATHNQFRLAINGADPITVTLTPPYATMALLAAAISGTGFSCAVGNDVNLGNRLVITSTAGLGENSRIEVLPGLANDVAVKLGLGPAYGGTQVDAAAPLRPPLTAPNATLTGTALAALPTLTGSLTISLDGNVAQTIDYSGLAFVGTLAQRLLFFAARLQADVRGLRPGVLAYDRFTVKVVSSGLVLASGSQGTGSSISLSGTLTSTLNLATAVGTKPTDAYLLSGSEATFSDSQAYNVYIGSRSLRQGIYALESVDIFNILCLPGIPNATGERAGILMDADAYCRERRAFFIIDCSRNDDTPAEMASAIVGTSLPKSDNAAVYYPWIKIPDPLNGSQPRVSAPCGMIAGIYARTDSSRGIWKAPAGTEATLNGSIGLDYTLTDPENGSLNPLGVNCLRTFPVYGSVVWGSRTLRGNDQMASEYKYVPIRRLAYYIEESLYRGLKWTVFEPNDEPLWAQIRLNAGAFMQNLFRQGAFQGQKRDDAYFVKCDKETTTQNDINLGIVNIWIGFAPLKPAEFVVLYIQQIAGQIQV